MIAIADTGQPAQHRRYLSIHEALERLMSAESDSEMVVGLQSGTKLMRAEYATLAP